MGQRMGAGEFMRVATVREVASTAPVPSTFPFPRGISPVIPPPGRVILARFKSKYALAWLWFGLFGAAGVDAVRHWRFHPARVGGQAVDCQLEVPLIFPLRP